MPVPRSRLGAAAPHAARVANASGPDASAVQYERYPRSAAWAATSTARNGPSGEKPAKVTPRLVNIAGTVVGARPGWIHRSQPFAVRPGPTPDLR